MNLGNYFLISWKLRKNPGNSENVLDNWIILQHFGNYCKLRKQVCRVHWKFSSNFPCFEVAKAFILSEITAKNSLKIAKNQKNYSGIKRLLKKQQNKKRKLCKKKQSLHSFLLFRKCVSKNRTLMTVCVIYTYTFIY